MAARFQVVWSQVSGKWFGGKETCVVMLSPDAGSFFDLVEVEVQKRYHIVPWYHSIMDTLSYGIVVCMYTCWGS